jgi:hypothetical protein
MAAVFVPVAQFTAASKRGHPGPEGTLVTSVKLAAAASAAMNNATRRALTVKPLHIGTLASYAKSVYLVLSEKRVAILVEFAQGTPHPYVVEIFVVVGVPVWPAARG